MTAIPVIVPIEVNTIESQFFKSLLHVFVNVAVAPIVALAPAIAESSIQANHAVPSVSVDKVTLEI